MKTQRNILIAFILNLSFSVFEFIGGAFCGSVAIVSDAVHDLGDAVSIGIAFFLERKSKKSPDDVYTYGYTRYSVIGGVITTSILIFGSLAVMYNAVMRIINPVEINYNGMLIFAVVGASVNFIAAFFTREGDSVNQKAVNLHMLEDVLGWVVVLMGALIMKFTDIRIIDPLMSLGVAVFILFNAVRTLKQAIDLFLEKAPDSISVAEIKEHLCHIDGVDDAHHIHIWSMDGVNNYATVHIVTDEEPHRIKHLVREEMAEHGISHITVEIETGDEHCLEKSCSVKQTIESGHHHHHH